MTESTTPTNGTTPDGKVLVCLNHGDEDPENVLIAYLVGVEALRAGKQALMFLTKEAIHLATPGFAGKIEVPGAPSVAALHEEYEASGGRFFACPVCVKTRNMQDAVVGRERRGRRHAVGPRVHDRRRARLQLLTGGRGDPRRRTSRPGRCRGAGSGRSSGRSTAASADLVEDVEQHLLSFGTDAVDESAGDLLDGGQRIVEDGLCGRGDVDEHPSAVVAVAAAYDVTACVRDCRAAR